jgi:hypothetical protein
MKRHPFIFDILQCIKFLYYAYSVTSSCFAGGAMKKKPFTAVTFTRQFVNAKCIALRAL